MAFVSAHLWQRHTSSEAKENCSDVLHPPGPQMDLTGHTHSPSGKRPCVRGWVWLCVVGGLGGGGQLPQTCPLAQTRTRTLAPKCAETRRRARSANIYPALSDQTASS